MHTRLSSMELRAGKVARSEFGNVPRREISIELDGVGSASNLGNIFRLADAMLVEKVWICGAMPVMGGKFKRAARGIDRWVEWEHRNSTAQLLSELRNSGCSIVAMELYDSSIPLHSFREPLTLVFGSESNGVSREALALCDTCVHLPMLGMGNSINLGNSVAIGLYEATRTLSGTL